MCVSRAKLVKPRLEPKLDTYFHMAVTRLIFLNMFEPKGILSDLGKGVKSLVSWF